MNMEGGGMGVGDVIDLFTFQSAAGATVGFLATFRSDGTRGIPTAGEGIVTEIPETGVSRVVSPTATVTLPEIGPVHFDSERPIRSRSGRRPRTVDSCAVCSQPRSICDAS